MFKRIQTRIPWLLVWALGVLPACDDTVVAPQPTTTPDPGVTDPTHTPEGPSPSPTPRPPSPTPGQPVTQAETSPPVDDSPTPAVTLAPTPPGGTDTPLVETDTPIAVTDTPFVDTDTPATPEPTDPPPPADGDGDGSAADKDCDDTNPAIFPGATEVCDAADNNCDGNIDEEGGDTWYADSDGDTYTSATDFMVSCNQPAGMAPASQFDDCDDTNGEVYPGAEEVCNGVDDNCDFQGEAGALDAEIWYLDGDGDGFGSTDTLGPFCEAPEGTSANNTDCKDDAPLIYPGATEVCDGEDNNCNTLIDENGDTPFYADADGDGYGSPGQVGVGCNAPAGYSGVSGDCGPDDNTVYPGANETCDSQDNDCDGDTDEAGGVEWMEDADDDGAGDPTSTVVACAMPDGYLPTNAPVDCDDDDGASYPGATEQCDGADNNCDGIVDEGVIPTWYRDVDSDTWGDDFNTRSQCQAPSGFVGRGDDCNDRNQAIHPTAAEVCDGVDNNCDGSVDEGMDTTWYLDADKDGYGAGTGLSACKAPSPAYVTTPGDCNDNSAAANPGATEICDQIDNNCNGSVDEGVTQTWYLDSDKDGYGAGQAITACQAPTPAYITTGGDCDDLNPKINPAGSEVCDGKDNNCDGQVDNGAPDATVWYADADDDGYGDDGDTVVACSAPSGFVDVGGDCDDTDDQTAPGAPELCDGVDNDCDGDPDSGAAGAAPECASPSCKDILTERTGIASGYFWIQPQGAAAPFEVYCDMSRAGGGWTRIYYQDTSTNTFFASTDLQLNKQEPRSSKYAILNDLQYFNRGGRFEFLMAWPGSSFTDFQQWYQTNNPVTDAPGTLPTGYQAIHVPYTYQGWTGGLQRSYYTQYSILDGTMDPLGNWYYAVGTTYAWNSLPTAMPGPTGGVAKAELYVR